jgi:hypothetical protein
MKQCISRKSAPGNDRDTSKAYNQRYSFVIIDVEKCVVEAEKGRAGSG